MPNNISVSAASAASETYVPGAAPQSPVTAQAATSIAATGAGLPNPSIQLDPALNIVVVQLHNSKGDITNSMPSLRQLDAYRTGQLQVPSVSGAAPPAAAATAPVATPAAAPRAQAAQAAPAATPAAAAPAPVAATSMKSVG